jgi:hypothetical protein
MPLQAGEDLKIIGGLYIMKSYKKFLSAVMAMAMLFSITACSENENSEESDVADSTTISDETSAADEADDSSSETDEDSDEEEAAVLASDYFDNTPVDDMNAVVMTINGCDITLEEYRYYFLNIKNTFDYGDDSYWDGSSEEDVQEKLDTLKEQVLTYLKNNYAVEKFADENNISLTAEEEKNSEEEFENEKEEYMTLNSMDDDGWQEYMDSIFCTDNLYIKSTKRRDLEYKLIRALYEDEFMENEMSNYVMAKHILIGTTGLEYDAKEIPEDATDEEIEEINAENEKLEEEAKKEKLAVAEEVLEKAKNGDDFDELITEYNEDPGETLNDDGTYDGYFFTTGEMVEEFENAAFALDENEISDIVETDYGYHIIKRVPVSDEYLEENIVDIMMTNSDYYEKYSTAAQKVIDAVEIEFSDIYDKINVISLT